MADEKATTPVAEGSPAVDATPAPATESKEETPAVAQESKADESAKDDAPAADKEVTEESDKAEAKPESDEKPSVDADVEMKDAEPTKADTTTEEAGVVPPPIVEAVAPPAGGASDAATPAKPSSSSSRRKSTGTPALKKKQSKARITHLDAQPGDHYLVKLKGYSKWPAVIPDEDMLTPAILKVRPVSAMRPDGTYREDFADGGKRVHERKFPVMYLHTNEFQWVVNTDLVELDPEALKDIKLESLKTKSLQEAYKLAMENHSLDYYKEELSRFEEDQRQFEEEAAARAEEEARIAEEKTAAKAAEAATPAKKSKKSKAKVQDDEDLEMPDADEEEEEAPVKKSSKKRKAEGTAETPQRTESVKKPKIKLTVNSTPKTNGTTSTPKATETKSAKSKSKKTSEAPVEKEMSVPQEPEFTPQKLHAQKEKKVLFLRHKLQKGLLTKGQEPKEEDMETMSGHIRDLEEIKDLEVSIIRATKINKVLKAIIKLDSIPKEEELKFKTRSQALLDQWNKILAADEPTNGTNGTSESKEKTNGTNGVKATAEAETKEETKASEEAKTEETKADEPKADGAATEESKDTEKTDEAAAPSEEKPADSTEAKESEAVAA